MDFGATDLSIVTGGALDVTAIDFVIPQGHLALEASGILGDIDTEVAMITVVNNGEVNGDIIVNETDDLILVNKNGDPINELDSEGVVVDQTSENGVLYTENGVIVVNTPGSLTHQSGVIRGMDAPGSVQLNANEVKMIAGLEAVNGDNLDINAAISNIAVTASISVEEGGGITYTATIYGESAEDIRVVLDNGQTITIPAGEHQGSVSVPGPSNDALIDPETVAVEILRIEGADSDRFVLSNDGMRLETLVEDAITPTTVALSAESSVVGGQPIVYTITLSHPVADGDTLTVVLSNGMEVRIPAGQTTASLEAPTTALPANSPPEIAQVFISKIDGNTRLEALEIIQGSLETSLEISILDPSQLALENLGSILAAASLAESADADAETVEADGGADPAAALSPTAGGDAFGDLLGGEDGGADGDFLGEAQVWTEEVYI
jgi:hypothetical protein